MMDDLEQPRKRRRWRRWVDGHAMALTIGCITVLGVGTVLGIRAEATVRTHAIEATADDARDQTCDEARNLRRLVGELITAAVADPGVALPLTDVPSYDLLPASVQTYLLELAAAAASDAAGPSLADRLTEFRETRLTDIPAFCRQEEP